MTCLTLEVSRKHLLQQWKTDNAVTEVLIWKAFCAHPLESVLLGAQMLARTLGLSSNPFEKASRDVKLPPRQPSKMAEKTPSGAAVFLPVTSQSVCTQCKPMFSCGAQLSCFWLLGQSAANSTKLAQYMIPVNNLRNEHQHESKFPGAFWKNTPVNRHHGFALSCWHIYSAVCCKANGWHQ